MFERSVEEQHRRLKTGLVAFVRSSKAVGFLVIAPVTYSLLIPFTLLDLFLRVYQPRVPAQLLHGPGDPRVRPYL